jgi:hypothetical protein
MSISEINNAVRPIQKTTFLLVIRHRMILQAFLLKLDSKFDYF